MAARGLISLAIQGIFNHTVSVTIAVGPHGEAWMPVWPVNRKLLWSPREHVEIRDTRPAEDPRRDAVPRKLATLQSRR